MHRPPHFYTEIDKYTHVCQQIYSFIHAKTLQMNICIIL